MTTERRRGRGLRIVAAALAMLLGPAAAPAQEPAAAGAPANACCTIPAETLVEVETLQEIRSGRNRTGEMFPIRLVEPIVVDGRTLVPAGAGGMGEVVHSARRGLVSSAPGELILALRYLEAKGVRIPLHRLQFSASGREGARLYIGGGSILIREGVGGSNITLPVGARLAAKVRGDVAIPAD